NLGVDGRAADVGVAHRLLDLTQIRALRLQQFGAEGVPKPVGDAVRYSGRLAPGLGQLLHLPPAERPAVAVAEDEGLTFHVGVAGQVVPEDVLEPGEERHAPLVPPLAIYVSRSGWICLTFRLPAGVARRPAKKSTERRAFSVELSGSAMIRL